MRNIFNALLKVIGIWMATVGVANVVNAASSIVNAMGMSLNYYLSLSGVYLIAAGVRFFLAWVLIFKTDWVADKARVPKDEIPCKPLERASLFPMGIQLAGVYFLFTAIPSMMYNFDRYFDHSMGRAISAGLPWAVQIGLAVLCILKADAIVKAIADKANVKWTKTIAIVFVVIGLLTVTLMSLLSTARKADRYFPPSYEDTIETRQDTDESDDEQKPIPYVIENDTIYL